MMTDNTVSAVSTPLWITAMVLAPPSLPLSAPAAGRPQARRASNEAPEAAPAPAGGSSEPDTTTHWLSQALAVWMGDTTASKPSTPAGDH